MATLPVLVNIDLNGNQILGLRLEVLASDPTGADLYEGRLWFNSADNLVKYYDGTGVVTVGTGVSAVTVDGTTIEDVGSPTNPSLRVKAGGVGNTQVGTGIAFNKIAAPAADFDVNSHKITNLSNGSAAGDAVNKGQLDAAVTGMDWKASVRVATTANGTLASAFENGDTVDGVTLATGDRILLKNQSSGAENGIYVVAASGAPARATDADANAEVTTGLAVFVGEGTVNGNSAWVLTTDDPITLGSTALTFVQFMGAGGVTPVSGGGTGATTAAGARANLGAAGPYRQTVGDGSTTTFDLNHALNATPCVVQVYEHGGSKRLVLGPEVRATDANNTRLIFPVAPTTNQYDVVIVG